MPPSDDARSETSPLPVSVGLDRAWSYRKRPPRLERRFEFDDYVATSQFLAHVAELSERTGLYPDLGFGRTYVNLTLAADETSGELTLAILDFARAVERLVAA